MQATARRLSVVSSTLPARRRLIRVVRHNIHLAQVRKKSQTVEEFIAKRNSDPVWVEQELLRNQELERVATIRREDERDLVQEIRGCGYEVTSVYDLVNNVINPRYPFLPINFTGSYERAYPILVKHLDLEHEFMIRQGIIRALTVKNAGAEAESALLRHFSSEKDQSTRWVIANALRVVMPRRRRAHYPEIDELYRNP